MKKSVEIMFATNNGLLRYALLFTLRRRLGCEIENVVGTRLCYPCSVRVDRACDGDFDVVKDIGWSR